MYMLCTTKKTLVNALLTYVMPCRLGKLKNKTLLKCCKIKNPALSGVLIKIQVLRG